MSRGMVLSKAAIRSEDRRYVICPMCHWNCSNLFDLDKWLTIRVDDKPAVDCELLICSNCYHSLQKRSVEQSEQEDASDD